MIIKGSNLKIKLRNIISELNAVDKTLSTKTFNITYLYTKHI